MVCTCRRFRTPSDPRLSPPAPCIVARRPSSPAGPEQLWQKKPFFCDVSLASLAGQYTLDDVQKAVDSDFVEVRNRPAGVHQRVRGGGGCEFLYIRRYTLSEWRSCVLRQVLGKPSV